MTSNGLSSTDSERTTKARNGLTDKLLADGSITSPALEEAFRRVPRHVFVPEGTPLEATYNADDSVTIKTDRHGMVISSTSAPFIQARMIEQAGLGRGMSVLEIGSGGYNVALLAEVVGPEGRVVSVDIDAEVTDRASALLGATGYGGRVTVAQADAGSSLAGVGGPFDAILVTAGAWDIAPTWLESLAGDGTLVVPLRMNGITRTIAFTSDGDHLASSSAEVCGFVPMQGTGAHDERVFLLPDAQGHYVRLRFDGDVPADIGSLDGVLTSQKAEVWSGITIERRVSFADLHLWFASFLAGFCKLAADDGTELAAEGSHWFPFGVVLGDSFAYLVVRPALGDAGVEFGARAYGRRGEDAASALVEQVQAWDDAARRGPAPTFEYWPTGTDRPPSSERTAVLPKTHGSLLISWPSIANAADAQGHIANPGNEE